MTAPDIPPPLAPKGRRGPSFRMGRTVMALLLREMSSRYGRSPGGYIWAVLEPVGMIVLLSIGFSLLVKAPPLGTSFILFFATGFIPFNLYQSLSNMVARAFIFSRALLSYPVVSWVDAILARFILNSLTGLAVGYGILFVILSLSEARVTIDLVPMIVSMGLAMGLGLGIGTVNCALIGLIPAWDRIWSIATRPLFLISGVIFLYEDMPPAAQTILWYNPLTHVVGLMRTGIYASYQASYISIPYVIMVTLIVLFFGVVLLGRYHREILTN